MIEPPQFRTVLRGADPEQVSDAIVELHTSLVTARQAVADKANELGRLEEEHSATQAALRDAERRIAELEEGQASQPSYHEVGSRISSILALADEEASRIQAAAHQEAEQILQQARQEAAAMRADVVEQRSEAVEHQDRVKAHLAELSGVIATLAASIPGSAPAPPEEVA